MNTDWKTWLWLLAYAVVVALSVIDIFVWRPL